MDRETSLEPILALEDRINDGEKTIIRFKHARNWNLDRLPGDSYNFFVYHHWFESFWGDSIEEWTY